MGVFECPLFEDENPCPGNMIVCVKLKIFQVRGVANLHNKIAAVKKKCRKSLILEMNKYVG